MRLGFDEVYVVTKDNTTLLCETLYDYKKATKIVKNLKNTGNERAEVITLEYAYANKYLVP